LEWMEELRLEIFGRVYVHSEPRTRGVNEEERSRYELFL
jgi:hypothetical protein